MSQKLPRINNEITSENIRLVAKNGDMIGVVSLIEAKRQARNENTDLIEISPNANPPVCKLMEFGKYKYEIQKKLADVKSKNIILEQKEIKVSSNIGGHDYKVKLKQTIGFVTAGHRVRVYAQLRGRERGNAEYIIALLRRVIVDCGENAIVASEPSMQGANASLILAPKKT